MKITVREVSGKEVVIEENQAEWAEIADFVDLVKTGIKDNIELSNEVDVGARFVHIFNLEYISSVGVEE